MSGKLSSQRRFHEYSTYCELAARHAEGAEYVVHRIGTNGPVLVMAPHGGGIEPGTFETARAIAHPDWSFYGFEGLKPCGNGNLHITSTRYDEPVARRMVSVHSVIVTLHGCTGSTPGVFIGGLHGDLMERMCRGLRDAGFQTGTRQDLLGTDDDNLCNRGTSGMGAQLEMTWGLRRLMFRDLTRAGRQEPTRVLEDFVAVMKTAIADHFAFDHERAVKRPAAATAPPSG